MKCPRCGFNPDPVNEPEYGGICDGCEEAEEFEAAHRADCEDEDYEADAAACDAGTCSDEWCACHEDIP